MVGRSLRRAAVSREFARRGLCLAVAVLSMAIGCRGRPNAAFTDLTEARQLTADLRVQFNRASDASNRAVMADTDEASVAFAHEAEQIKTAVRTDVAALTPHLQSLNEAADLQLLEGFENHFAEYEKLDGEILELAVENTNLKAQRLSFGPAREDADALRDALTPLASHVASREERCRAESLVAKAIIAVREIQALQAPHIAESEDSVMTHLEGQMAGLNSTARDAVKALGELLEPGVQPQVATAMAALERFEDISKKIVALSRRNSNVRSVELSIRQKPVAAAACDASLRALQDALAKQAFSGTR